MENEANVPFLQALLVCDYVIIEAGTNKKSAIGIFDNLWSEVIPFQGRMGVLARLTDMEGEYALSIKVVRIEGVSEHAIVKGAFAPVTVANRLHRIDLALNFYPACLITCVARSDNCCIKGHAQPPSHNRIAICGPDENPESVITAAASNQRTLPLQTLIDRDGHKNRAR